MRHVDRVALVFITASLAVACELFLPLGDAPNGNSSSDASTPTADADGSDANDDGGTPRVCDVNTPFNAPTMIVELNTSGNESGLRLSGSYLSAYFESTRSNDAGIAFVYTASRVTTTSPFTNIVLMATLADSGATGLYSPDPSVTGDDLNLFFAYSNEIMVAQRASTISTFGTPTVVLGLENFAVPFVREDGLVLYVDSTSNNAIYRSEKGPSGFNPPTMVDELYVPGISQGAAVVTPDDLVIYYSTARTDGDAQGGRDIWVATRASVSAPFSNLRAVKEINTSAGEKSDFVTRDRCTIFFHRQTVLNGGAIQQSIWVAHKETGAGDL